MLRTVIISAVIGSLVGVLLSVCGGAAKEAILLPVSSAVEASRIAPRCLALRHPASKILAHTQTTFTALDLLWNAESSRGKNMVGDSGKARGHFQHWKVAWDYGTAQLGVNWPYSDADSLPRAAAVVGACWSKQARKGLIEGDIELLIRAHRLPNDPFRPSNDAYLKYVMEK